MERGGAGAGSHGLHRRGNADGWRGSRPLPPPHRHGHSRSRLEEVRYGAEWSVNGGLMISRRPDERTAMAEGRGLIRPADNEGRG